MNREEKTHWTQDKILLYVKACMSATGLTRMPSRSELSEYYGNDKLTNAIRRFPGGYYKIAEILNVEMKESEARDVLDHYMQPFELVDKRFYPNNMTVEEHKRIMKEMEKPVDKATHIP